jgi:hypothetical protein
VARAVRNEHFGASEDPSDEHRERMARGTEFTSKKRRPEGGWNPKRGAAWRKAKHQPRGTSFSTEQSLEVEGAGRGSRLAGELKARNDMGARDGDESAWLRRRKNP